VASGSGTSCSISSVATCWTSWNTRTPTATPASASSLSDARTPCTSLPFGEDEQTVFLKTSAFRACPVVAAGAFTE